MILSGEFDATNSVEVGQCLFATWVYTTVTCAKEVIKIYFFENPKFFFFFSFFFFFFIIFLLFWQFTFLFKECSPTAHNEIEERKSSLMIKRMKRVLHFVRQTENVSIIRFLTKNSKFKL